MGLHSNCYWLDCNNWGSVGGVAVSMGLGSVQGTGLAGDRSLDGMADLSGDWVALFNWDLDCDGVRDLGTSGDRLGAALGLWDSSGDGVASGDWLGNTDSLWNSSGDGGTGLSGNWGALGNTDTLGNSHTVWGGDSSGNWNTDWNLDTVRNRHTLGNSNSSDMLDWNLSALSVNLLLTLSGNWSSWGSNTNNSWGSRNSWSKNLTTC